MLGTAEARIPPPPPPPSYFPKKEEGNVSKGKTIYEEKEGIYKVEKLAQDNSSAPSQYIIIRRAYTQCFLLFFGRQLAGRHLFLSPSKRIEEEEPSGASQQAR